LAELEIKPTRAARLRVLTVAAVAIVILAYLVYLLAGGGASLFARQTTLTTYMPDATGLIPGSSGSEVRLSGITVGHVGVIQVSSSLDPQRAVRVELRVMTRYLKNIPSDSQTDISSDTLVGYQFVDIAEGKSPIPVGENGMLASQPVKESLMQTDLVKTLQDDLAGADRLLAQISSGQTRVGQFVVGEALHDQLLSEVRGFDQALHTFLTPRSNLGQAFYSLEAYNDIHNLALQVDQSLASIQNGEGTAGRLFTSDEQYNTLVRQLVDFRTQLANFEANPMLQDDAAYVNMQRMLKSTNALLASLNAGRLVNNAQLYDSLNGSLKSMENLLRDIRENPRKYERVKLRH
jgi:phospholipid/cholesterol/gamma-HCH transport system substrate-binding protein